MKKQHLQEMLNAWEKAKEGDSFMIAIWGMTPNEAGGNDINLYSLTHNFDIRDYELAFSMLRKSREPELLQSGNNSIDASK